ncbi:MAG: fatty acid hydroxylase family protein [Candidatus Hydrogenedens sp.]|nr:fatty acid hydroxylase family protein [Candidatus Hydrogenedens sp.]
MGLTASELDELPYRVAMRDKFPQHYSAAFHFLIPNVLSVTAIATAFSFTQNIQPLEWLMLPGAFLVANLIEWWVHKGPLHHRRPGLEIAFERHTLSHHEYFHDDSMAAAKPRDYYYVLFPVWGIFAIFVPALPIAAAAWFAFSWNAAMLFLATAAFYFIFYEWMHLIYHLPENHPVVRARFMQFLQRHHRLHHNKRLMQKYNFNVTFPIADYLFGTAYREPTRESLSGTNGARS